MAMPAGMPIAKPQNTPFLWSLDQYSGNGQPDLPAWLPFLYGKHLGQVILGCEELAGKSSVPPLTSGPALPPNYFQPQNATAAPSIAAPVSPPPRRSGATGATSSKVWKIDDGSQDVREMTEDEILQAISAKKFNPEGVIVWTNGMAEWREIGQAIPAVLAVAPF
jgi:hypothetical protein